MFIGLRNKKYKYEIKIRIFVLHKKFDCFLFFVFLFLDYKKVYHFFKSETYINTDP
jgi:hypothetical protein